MSGRHDWRRHTERLRYAQSWEDADVLVESLDVRPDSVCLSIASAGDNTMSLLSRGPARVIALDVSAAELACLELRVAACRELSRQETLCLIGSVGGDDRLSLYRKCRPHLAEGARRFWDARPDAVIRGIGHAGRFESYFSIFRRYVLPLMHTRQEVEDLVARKSAGTRRSFYERVWDNRRWRVMFRLFFSRAVMGRLARDRTFFRYVEGSVSDRILNRARHALTRLDPFDNPYLQWILFGEHRTALPHWLREQNFERARQYLDRLELRNESIEDFLRSCPPGSIDRFNLSDIFEYVSEDEYVELLGMIARAGAGGALLTYWNMLAPRTRPAALADVIVPRLEVSRRLHERDKAFFYSALVAEEVAA